MKRKRLFRFILPVILLMTVVPSFADSGSSKDTSTSKSGEAVLNTVIHNPDVKRIPSRNVLELIYSDDMMSLSSNYYEGEFGILFENSETGVTVSVPSITVGETCHVNLDCGEYTVTAERSDGLVFQGLLEINY